MGDDPKAQRLGSGLCAETVPPGLLDSTGQVLSDAAMEVLWDLFVQIGRSWHNVQHDSADLRSSWLEFIAAKTDVPPSYIGEYCNAVDILEELIAVHGSPAAFDLLFFQSGIPNSKPTTRLAHTKVYVVNEFIRVQVVAGGFRGFGGTHRNLNYNGFVRGSRYNRMPQVRAYHPGKDH